LHFAHQIINLIKQKLYLKPQTLAMKKLLESQDSNFIFICGEQTY